MRPDESLWSCLATLSTREQQRPPGGDRLRPHENRTLSTGRTYVEGVRESQFFDQYDILRKKEKLIYFITTPWKGKNRRGKNVDRRCAYGRYPHNRQTCVAPVSVAGGRGSFSRANSFLCLSDGGCDVWGGNPILCCAGTCLYSVLGATGADFLVHKKISNLQPEPSALPGRASLVRATVSGAARGWVAGDSAPRCYSGLSAWACPCIHAHVQGQGHAGCRGHVRAPRAPSPNDRGSFSPAGGVGDEYLAEALFCAAMLRAICEARLCSHPPRALQRSVARTDGGGAPVARGRRRFRGERRPDSIHSASLCCIEGARGRGFSASRARGGRVGKDKERTDSGGPRDGAFQIFNRSDAEGRGSAQGGPQGRGAEGQSLTQGAGHLPARGQGREYF